MRVQTKEWQRCANTIVPFALIPENGNDFLRVDVDNNHGPRLDVNVTRELVDRSHRLGQRHVGPSGEYKPRPIIVKFRSYETRSSVFSAKRRLKGTKYVVTENLTRRRNDLLTKVRSLDTVSCAWTTDALTVGSFAYSETDVR